jgi:hypothetical protein
MAQSVLDIASAAGNGISSKLEEIGILVPRFLKDGAAQLLEPRVRADLVQVRGCANLHKLGLRVGISPVLSSLL